MALIIDGYNLLNAVGIPSEEGSLGNLERARGALLNFSPSLSPETSANGPRLSSMQVRMHLVDFPASFRTET